MEATDRFFEDCPRGRKSGRRYSSPPPQKNAKRPREVFSKDFIARGMADSYRLTPIKEEELIFRHSGWITKRARIREVFASCLCSRGMLDRWDNCGGDCMVEWSPSLKKHRLRANYCKNRHCEPCSRMRANRIAANLRSRIGEGMADDKRFVTLSMRHTDTPLKDQIRRLYKCFKKMREDKKGMWALTQDGGVIMLEVKIDPESPANKRRIHNGLRALWHPHLHIITQGTFIHVRDLKRQWLAVTGDSDVVDIRSLDSGRDVAHYITKYVTKGCNAAVWDDLSFAQEFVTAMRGVRVAATFGSWRGLGLMKVTQSADDWEPVGKLPWVVRCAREGAEWAAGVLLSLRPPGQELDADNQARAPPAADSRQQ